MKGKKIRQNIFCKTNPRGGISLIVLVITIIIMIILATAVILSLSSSNIVDKANTATQRSDFSNAKSVAATAYGESMLDGLTGDAEITYVQEKLDASFGAGKYIAGERGQVAPIPKGFTVSSITGETTIAGGLVIYEGTTSVTNADSNGNGIIDAQEQRNQFVWVPVEGEFSRGKADGIALSTNVTEPSSYGGSTDYQYDTEVLEYQSMRDSVEEYGGFYIGRYEAGSETQRGVNAFGTTRLVVKKDFFPYNNVNWGISMTNVKGDVVSGTTNFGKGAVELSKEIYSDSNSVVSTLCYGVQWDAIMKWMKDIPNITNSSKKYVLYSEGMGWYDRSVHKTGEDMTTNGVVAANKVNNIYDIAGNVEEWTMEAYQDFIRVPRGGDTNGNYKKADVRVGVFNFNKILYTTGFRVALYIK